MDNIELQADLPARQRIELTRSAIARQLERRRRPAPPAEDPALAQQQGMLARVRRAGRVWWSAHPVHYAVDFARPALQDYAEHKPYRLLGVAAGAGVALAVLRAWRVVPLTGLALALMKSSDLKAVARSFAAAPEVHPVHPREEEDARTVALAAAGNHATGT